MSEIDPFFRASDINQTTSSRVTTTRHDTSNLMSRNSGTFNMVESFAQKSLIDEEQEDYEDSTTELRKNQNVKVKKRRKNLGGVCADGCTIF